MQVFQVDTSSYNVMQHGVLHKTANDSFKNSSNSPIRLRQNVPVVQNYEFIGKVPPSSKEPSPRKIEAYTLSPKAPIVAQSQMESMKICQLESPVSKSPEKKGNILLTSLDDEASISNTSGFLLDPQYSRRMPPAKKANESVLLPSCKIILPSTKTGRPRKNIPMRKINKLNVESLDT